MCRRCAGPCGVATLGRAARRGRLTVPQRLHHPADPPHGVRSASLEGKESPPRSTGLRCRLPHPQAATRIAILRADRQPLARLVSSSAHRSDLPPQPASDWRPLRGVATPTALGGEPFAAPCARSRSAAPRKGGGGDAARARRAPSVVRPRAVGLCAPRPRPAFLAARRGAVAPAGDPMRSRAVQVASPMPIVVGSFHPAAPVLDSIYGIYGRWRLAPIVGRMEVECALPRRRQRSGATPALLRVLRRGACRQRKRF
ncbi:unnamed protein product [Amoebophrya sp. A120]|nr:unnamed protein product [Amoebophrya sp. A120]|eukprot:GSA120T00004066001.1